MSLDIRADDHPPKDSVLARLTAGAFTLPFLLAVPNHYVPEKWWWNASLWVAIGAIYMAARLASQRVAQFRHGNRLSGVFAALYLVLELLRFTTVGDYRLPQAVTDLALLYLVFFVATATAQIAVPVGRAVLAVLVAEIAITAILQAAHLHTFGFEIGRESYRAILQSNTEEVFEFVDRFLGRGTFAAGLLAFVIPVAVALCLPAMRVPRESLAWAGMFALAAIAVVAGSAGIAATRVQGFVEVVDYVVELWEFRALREARAKQGPGLAVAQSGPLAGRAQTYVFVVGESLTRNHMSLYGYWRNTTPVLSRLAGEMAVLTDVVSPHSHTEQSLERVLTLANQTNGLRYTDATNYSLIELLRAAGFSTWWISNQNTFGPWDNKTAVLASGAEHVHYIRERSGRSVLGPLDEALLEPFAAALHDPAPRKAIFLHFLGNHWEYDKRYPSDAAYFRLPPTSAEIGALRATHTRLDLVDQYDNAVRYHDHLIGQLVEMLRATRLPAVLTLFSDHGENVYELKNHFWKEFTRDHVEVPLLLWFSPEYSRVAGDVVARARANAGLPFALEDLPHLVASLTGMHSPAFEAQRSPLSSTYRSPHARHLFEGTLVYEEADEAFLNARRMLARIALTHPQLRKSLWAHRVDTIGKMKEVAMLFAGAEIDVLYDPARRALMVNHPPEPLSGLTLDAQLGYAHRLNPELALWLDIKNFNEVNAPAILAELNRLDTRYAIRARALVETDYTGPAAAELRRAGYLSSYYLPTKVVTQSAVANASSNCDGAAGLQRAVQARRFAAVSFDWRGSHWVEHCLGRFVRENSLRTYTWDLEPVISNPPSHSVLTDQRLRKYTGMAAVLLPYHSVFDDLR